MYKSKFTLIIGLLLVMGLLLLAACSSATTSTTTTTLPGTTSTATTTAMTTTTATTTATTTVTAPVVTVDARYGGTLRVIWSNTPASGFGWGPKIFGGEGFPAEPAMEPLLEGKFLGGYVNRLATDYKVAADGTMTFTLRKGVKFHDGTDFNADAVKFNIDAMIKAGKYGKEVLSCTVVDAYTVSVSVSEFKNTTLSTVAGTVMASPTAVKAKGEDWAAINAVGTGPFKQVSYEPDVKIKLEKFDGYWGQKPYLDAIEGTFITDRMTQVMAMKAGQGDVIHSRQALTTYELSQAGFLCKMNLMGMEGLNFNSRDAASPFYKLEARMAAEYAINKTAIIDTLGHGFWQVADQMPVAGQNGYLADLKPRTYDPAKAKQLLAQAGYPNGFSTKIIHAIGDFEDGAASIQADLADVGIKAEMVVIDWGKWGPMRQQGWEGIFLAGSGLISDSNAFLDSYFRVGSTEMYSINRPAGFQDLIQQAVKANPADNAKTQAAMRVLFDQCLWVPIEHHGDNFSFSSKVQGLNNGTYGQWGAFDSELVWLTK
jgi:peptide/nickel transport system substrate-binding protein